MRRLIEWRARRAWLNPVLAYQAEAHMRFLVGRTERAAEVPELAWRYLVEYFTFNETLFRPWLITRGRVEQVDRLHEAAAEGRGVIIHFLHHAQYIGALASLAKAGGATLHAPAHGPLLDSASSHPDHGQLVRIAESGGIRLFPATGSYTRMRELLARGRAVAIAGDVTGNSRVNFLGRDVRCASGPWRLARETGSPVVPVTVRRDAAGQTVVVEEPVDPRPYREGTGLHRRILAAHEASVLQWPEAMRRPLIALSPCDDDAMDLALDDPRLAAMQV